jgi:hypothetical protein
MYLFILDLGGTLDTMSHPHAWLNLLRAHYPGAKLVLWSGMGMEHIHNKFPGLLAAMDAYWPKPLSRLGDLVRAAEWEPTEIVVVDDDAALRRTADRMLRKLGIPITLVEPANMASLVRLPDLDPPPMG